MIPTSLKQRIALAIKAKQNAAQQGTGQGMALPPSQPLSVQSTMPGNPAPTKPVFAQAQNTLNQGKFFKIKKKLGY